MRGPWSEAARREYLEGGFNGLVLPSRSWRPADLEFLRDLPGLELFSLTSSLKRDTAAFEIETLRKLTLVTGSKAAVAMVPQAAMETVCLTHRPGLDIGGKWPSIKWLRIGMWLGADYSLLANAGVLEELRVEARRQAGSLEGLEALSRLRVLRTVNYSIGSLAPLAGLTQLEEVRLMAAHPCPPHGRFDLSALRSPMLRSLWVSNCAEFLHLEVLGQLPRLREVRFVECRLSQADRRLLAMLPPSVSVQLVDG